jgi:hypothetical protein
MTMKLVMDGAPERLGLGKDKSRSLRDDKQKDKTKRKANTGILASPE